MIDLTRRLRLNGSNPLVMYNGHKMMRSYLGGIAMNDSNDLTVEYSAQWFTIESLADYNRISLNKNSSGSGIVTTTTFYVSTDGEHWEAKIFNWNNANASITWTVNKGEKLLFKCNTSRLLYFYFSSTNACNVSGNINSLVFGDNFQEDKAYTSTYVFSQLFRNCKIVDAHNLVLPATTLVQACYGGMFSGCTSLVEAPVLPATTLAQGCYGDMFSGCTSLVKAPALPATTLAQACYGHMFEGCTSLVEAPVLPANMLALQCYRYMFSGCTSLAKAPDLLADTLVQECYYSMFYDCTSLNEVKCLAKDISAGGSLTYWLTSVAATGIFTKATGAEWPIGQSGIPSGWTVIDA